jgi:hypothetical protein
LFRNSPPYPIVNDGRLRIWDTVSAGFGTGLDYISHEKSVTVVVIGVQH